MANLYSHGGYAILNGTAVMTTPGAEVDRPRNLEFPYPVGNRFGQVNYAEGARFPVMRIPVIGMASYLTAANINTWFLTRGGAAPYDVAALGSGVEMADVPVADAQYKMTGAKGAGFTLNFRFGQRPLMLQTEWHGTQFAAASGAPATAFMEADLLTFAEVTFSGATFGTKNGNTRGILGGTITYSNQLTPNETLNGTHFPTEHNADVPTVQLAIQMYADDTWLPPGYTDRDTYTEISDCGVHIKLAPAVYTSFTFTKLVLNNPNARRVMQGRGIRQIVYQGRATTAAYPLVCAQT